MTDKAYNDLCADLFLAIETLLDERGVDFDNNGNIIDIVTDDDEKIVINKQPAMSEVWLASKKDGRHFAHRNGEWRDTRDGSLFMEQLRALLDE